MASSKEILKKFFVKEFRWDILYYLFRSGGVIGILFLLYYYYNYKKNQPLSADESKVVAKSSHNTVERGNIYTVGVHLTGGDISAPLILCSSQVEKKALPKIFQPQIPFLAESLFVERAALNQLKEILQANDSKPQESPMVLAAYKGLGGVGKTQLALYYYYKSQKSYSFKCWFSAEQEDILDQQYREFCAEYSIPFNEKASPLNLEVQKKVKHYLENNPGWLLVYDNVKDSTMIGSYLPRTNGDIVLTSRHRFGWDQVNGQTIEVGVLEKEEAVELIKRAMSISGELSEEERISLNKLVHELGYLPLALAQAAAYIKNYPTMKTTDYLHKYCTMPDILLEQQALMRDVYPQSVAKTWFITMEAIQTQSPAALQLLQMCAYLAPDAIPLEIFSNLTKVLPEEKSNEEKTRNATRHVAPGGVEMLSTLSHFSMVSYDQATESINIHRLVQTVIRHHEAKTIQADVIVQRLLKIAKCLDSLYCRTKDSENYTKIRILVIHIETAITHLQSFLPNNTINKNSPNASSYQEMAIVFRKLGNMYRLLGDSAKKCNMLEQALQINEIFYEPNTDIIAKVLTDLGNAYYKMDNLKKAQMTFERALKINKENNYDEGIARVLTELGNVYYKMGNLEQARDTLEKALKINEEKKYRQQVIARVFTQLGIVYRELGDLEKALNNLSRALEINKENCRGEKCNPMVLAKIYTEIGVAYRQRGANHNKLQDVENALSCLEYASKINEEYFGPDSVKVVEVERVYKELEDTRFQYKQMRETQSTIYPISQLK